jgi:protein-L-isoaspartate(D-aspartate) O-methyltransferase
MAAVPRERFVPEALRRRAYDDAALPIGAGQTISQPLIVGIMLEALRVRPGDRVLEVGTGSGYQAVLLARLAQDVTGVERVPALLERAREAIAAIGCTNIHVFAARDMLGWPERSPYDRIIVAAGAPHVPRALIEQLAMGGVMVLPIGTPRSQELVRVTKTSHGMEIERLGPCAFVPLVGAGAWDDGAAVLR